jgi:hypothetical protein
MFLRIGAKSMFGVLTTLIKVLDSIQIVDKCDVGDYRSDCRTESHPERLSICEPVVESMFYPKDSDDGGIDYIYPNLELS